MELGQKIVADGTATLFRNKFKYATEINQIFYRKESVQKCDLAVKSVGLH
jgi:hypothetical protein